MAEQPYEQQYLEFVDDRIRWNKRTADRTMVQYISVRLGLVLVSAALPALTMLQDRIWAIAASVAIASLTGLDTHFQWGDEWRHFRTTQLALEKARRDYGKSVDDLSRAGGHDSARAKQEMFPAFYDEVENVLQKDSVEFFKFRITPWRRHGADASA